MNELKKMHSALVVDDEKQICELIHGFLIQTDEFHSVVEAESMTQAAQKIHNQHFDIIITDYLLIGKSGLDLIKYMSQITKYRRVKILLISGYLKKDDLSKALAMNVKNILVKPFTKKQLLDKVFQMLKITEL